MASPVVRTSSRKEAREKGLTQYMGKPCPHGHNGPRRTSNGKCLGCAKQWFKDRPERTKVYHHKTWFKHHDVNKKKARVRQNANYAADRSPFLFHIKNRRARLKGAEGFCTNYDLHDILEKQGLSCLCGVSFLVTDSTIDHKTPLSRGGSNWPENIQLLCGPCNGNKGSKTMEEWTKWPFR